MSSKQRLWAVVTVALTGPFASSSRAQVINYKNDPLLAKARECDLEMNGGDLEKGNRAEAERYYLAYLKTETDSAQRARVYAQLGALYAVAINPTIGEKPDYRKARMYFRKVLELEPRRIARPTIAARSQLASMKTGRRERFDAWRKFAHFMASLEGADMAELWLPSYGPNTPPTESELIGLRGLCEAISDTSGANMVGLASEDPVLLAQIIEEFPNTSHAEKARQALRRTGHQAVRGAVDATDRQTEDPSEGRAPDSRKAPSTRQAEQRHAPASGRQPASNPRAPSHGPWWVIGAIAIVALVLILVAVIRHRNRPAA